MLVGVCVTCSTMCPGARPSSAPVLASCAVMRTSAAMSWSQSPFDLALGWTVPAPKTGRPTATESQRPWLRIVELPESMLDSSVTRPVHPCMAHINDVSLGCTQPVATYRVPCTVCAVCGDCVTVCAVTVCAATVCAATVCAVTVCAGTVCAATVCAVTVCAATVCAVTVCAVTVCAVTVCDVTVRAVAVFVCSCACCVGCGCVR